MDNRSIADLFDRVAELLAAQQASPFRVRAYSAAAFELRALPEQAAQLLEREGIRGLERLPRIGPAIARAIAEAVRSGRLRLLDRLEGELCHEQEACPQAGASSATVALPSVAELLAVDARYRELASKGALPTIAPRRFNPERVAWLPVLHTECGGYHVTALFSNTARAHALGTTRDWVVIAYEDARGEGQCTVVTERRGALSGLRVVRGREAECLEEHKRSFAQAQRQLRDRDGQHAAGAGPALRPEPAAVHSDDAPRASLDA